ncbi:uncharacterized protein RJT21DRAFT_82830 [Scheffersomyces amazonensis]|uniref:uncharacterized protein n=1 Tax=Scheffersomyces amazonensis TaxID=1078765 RepID=UPI00315D464B
MSAYAALRDSDSISSLLNELNNPEENGVIGYSQNSSDEEEPISLLETPSEQTITNQKASQISSLNQAPPISSSRFTPTKDNIVFGDQYVIVGLKVNEYIMINGQFKLNIQRGAILLNNIHYLYAQRSSHEIIAPSSSSLPVIASTQVLNRAKVEDQITEENEHLFSSDYKSVVKIWNLRTGLENIGKYYSPFKRLIFNQECGDENLNEYEVKFLDYSFELVLYDNRMIGLNIDKSWTDKIKEIICDINDQYSPKIIMAIGNKNSGKSTMNKTLINSILTESDSSSISYLDLDPGQPEYSKPYSLSLTRIENTNFGTKFASSTVSDSCKEHYFGYTSPVHNPGQYISIIRSLFNYYEKNNKQMGDHLIINTPGWIKGYGREILIELSTLIEPDYLLILSSSLDPNSRDNIELAAGLKFKKPMFLEGVYQTSRYSPVQLRILNKLIYFHQRKNLEFEFAYHILKESPLRISYQTINSPDEFIGVNAITVLGLDVISDSNYEDVPLMLESSIVGIYLVDHEYFYSHSHLLYKSSAHDNLPLYLSNANYNKMVAYDAWDKFVFMGLTMIHSINRFQNYFSVYLPEKLSMDIKEHLGQGFKMLLVKGEGEIASPEILNPYIISKKTKQLARLSKKRRSGIASSDESVISIPYVSFEAKNKVGGVWRIRRNVQRRSHQRT